MRVRPAREGLKVPMPERAGRFLRPEGELVPPSTYWLRTIRRGDVVVLADEEPAAERAVEEAPRNPPRRAPRAEKD